MQTKYHLTIHCNMTANNLKNVLVFRLFPADISRYVLQSFLSWVFKRAKTDIYKLNVITLKNTSPKLRILEPYMYRCTEHSPPNLLYTGDLMLKIC